MLYNLANWTVWSINRQFRKKQHKLERNGEADRADEHEEQLLDRIRYHRHIIDECTAEMTDCDRRIDEYRALKKSQQELIRKKEQWYWGNWELWAWAC